jgi:molybdate transport system substrate-binding protein
VRLLLVVALLALTGCTSTPARTVDVFAAASLSGPFERIAEEFEAENPGTTVVFNFGGCPGLAAQIEQGAPADVFAAASTDFALPNSQVFATNWLEIAVAVGNPGDVQGLHDFARPELALALCAVEVPCGAASADLLDHAGVIASIDTFEQDVRAVLTKIQLGELDAGLVYATEVRAAGETVERIELADTPINDYPIMTLTESDAAAAFVRFVLSPRGQDILAEAGFGAP